MDLAGWIGLAAFLVLSAGLIVVPLHLLRRRAKREPLSTGAKIIVDETHDSRAMAALKASDPFFNLASFSERSCRVMREVHSARLQGDLSCVRCLMTEAIYLRLQKQLELSRSAGWRSAAADWRILAGEVITAEADDQWNTVLVKLIGETRQVKVPWNLPQEEVALALKDAPLQRFAEVWSFSRRRGSVGEHDWVLSEITLNN